MHTPCDLFTLCMPSLLPTKTACVELRVDAKRCYVCKQFPIATYVCISYAKDCTPPTYYSIACPTCRPQAISGAHLLGCMHERQAPQNTSALTYTHGRHHRKPCFSQACMAETLYLTCTHDKHHRKAGSTEILAVAGTTRTSMCRHSLGLVASTKHQEMKLLWFAGLAPQPHCLP